MLYENMYSHLNKILCKPEAYACYTSEQMWNDPYISNKMLELHLSETEAAASRPKQFIDRSIQWIVDRFKMSPQMQVCDFGCGPGLYTSAFAKTGAQVTGIDFSERSIRYAKQMASKNRDSIDYINENYLNFVTDQQFDLITMIYCDFAALNDNQRKQLLAQFKKICATNGFILLDVFSLKYYATKQETYSIEKSSNRDIWSNFWSPDPYYLFANTYKYDEKKLLLDKYVVIEAKRTREIYNWIKCYDLPSITAELAESGFEVIDYYANVAGDPFTEDALELAVIAKKRN